MIRSDRASIEVLAGAPFAVYLMDRREYLVGRSVRCNLVLREASVSRVHARIWHEDGRYFVADLGSRHGLFVNERRVERAQLSEGSRVRIGRVLLVFHSATQASIGSRPRPDAPRDVFALMESFLDQIPTGVILFRPGEGLLAMNRAARLMFPAGAEGAPGLRALLRVGRRGDRREVRSLPRGGERPPVVATRIRLAEQAYAIVLFDPELAADRATAEAQALFGLTRAEAAVVGALLRGRTLREAAADLGVARNTVRAQLQSVFQKTDARRQADLVRLLLAAAPGMGLVNSPG